MDTEMIGYFFKNYGWQLGVLALSGIVVLGLLKRLGVFKKIKDGAKKYVYFGCSCALSIIACLIYTLILGAFEIVSFALLCGSIILFTLAVYGVYENTGARWLLNKGIDLLIKVVKKLFSLGKITPEKFRKVALEMGSQALVEITNEVRKKEVEEQQKQAEENKTNA